MNTEDYYNSRFLFDEGRTKVWKAINEYLQPFVGKQAAVLDIGCGYADFINGIQATTKYAVDLNPKMSDFIQDSKTVFFAQSVLDVFDIQDSSLDVVFASNLLEHFDDRELDILIGNIKKKLKSGGKLILIQPNYFFAYREYWDDYTHKKAFSHVSLTDFLVSKGFKSIVVKKRFLPFSLKSRLPKSYLLTKIYLNSPFKPLGKQMLIVAEKNEQ
jgi:SAM-dependent methyltransferase